MNTDSLYLIGKSHKVCQDYAIHGTIDGTPYFIVSDGCSSSKDVDIGARLLAQCAKITMLKKPHVNLSAPQPYFGFGSEVIKAARLATAQLSLPNYCLDATLMVGFVQNNIVYVYIYGDGVILLDGVDGVYEYKNIQFSENAPFYLTYWDNPDAMSSYLYYYNQAMTIDEFDGHNNGTAKERCEVDRPLIYSFDLTKYKSIVLSTDGINSFVDYDKNVPVDIGSVAQDMIKFKNTKGEFLKRRIERKIDELSVINVHHYDDIGMAGITL